MSSKLSKSGFSNIPTYFPSSDQLLATASTQATSEGSDEGDNESASGDSPFNVSKYIGIVLRKYWLLAICGVLMGLNAGYKTSKEVVKFKSDFRILVEPVTSQQSIDTLTNSGDDIEIDYFTLIEVLYSPKILEPVAEEVALQYPGMTYDQIAGMLKVVRLGETKILEGRFVDTNKDRLKLILNKVSQAYLEYSIEEQHAQYKKALTFIEEQLPKLQQDSNRLQATIQEMRETYGFMEPEAFAGKLAQEIDQLRLSQRDIQTELATMQFQYRQMQAELNSRTVLTQSAKYKALLGELQVLEKDIALESARFGPRHPTIQLLKRQQENLVPLMLREAERSLGEELARLAHEMLILETRYKALSNAALSLKLVFDQMPALSREYDELQRDLQVTNNNLNKFLETQETLKIQASQNEVPWQLIAETRNPEMLPVGNPVQAMMSGTITGVVLGFAIAYGIEKFEDTYHNLEEAKQQKLLKVLGAIPIYPDLQLAGPSVNIVDLRHILDNKNHSMEAESVQLKQQIKQLLSEPVNDSKTQEYESLIHKLDSLPISQATTENRKQATSNEKSSDNSSPWLEEYDAYGFLEAFRALYLNINRQGIYNSLNSLVVTSALPQEGRTTVTIHLAQAAAAMGRRVLIVDTHLRQGAYRLHNLLGLSNQKGLSEYLQGRASLTQVTQRLSWEQGLYAITSGQPPPDPTRLLSSTTMYELTLQLRKNFELVIYDMPPMMGLADVGLVAANIDGVVLVNSLNKRGSITALKNTMERLKLVQANVIGMVVNKAKNYKVDLYA